jgi:uncharacterized cupredoxin-like copper-binding protein
LNRLAFRLALVGTLVLVLAGCSTASLSPSMHDMGDGHSDMPMTSDGHGEFAWGEPAEASDADRVVEISMLDELRFDPDAVEVAVGETVTFRVTNDGRIVHDFTLCDEHMQEEHDAEMAEGMPDMGHDEPNVLTLEAGQSGELTWRFTAPASILYGCPVPGHYDAGMVGTVAITGS